MPIFTFQKNPETNKIETTSVYNAETKSFQPTIPAPAATRYETAIAGSQGQGENVNAGIGARVTPEEKLLGTQGITTLTEAKLVTHQGMTPAQAVQAVKDYPTYTAQVKQSDVERLLGEGLTRSAAINKLAGDVYERQSRETFEKSLNLNKYVNVTDTESMVRQANPYIREQLNLAMAARFGGKPYVMPYVTTKSEIDKSFGTLAPDTSFTALEKITVRDADKYVTSYRPAQSAEPLFYATHKADINPIEYTYNKLASEEQFNKYISSHGGFTAEEAYSQGKLVTGGFGTAVGAVQYPLLQFGSSVVGGAASYAASHPLRALLFAANPVFGASYEISRNPAAVALAAGVGAYAVSAIRNPMAFVEGSRQTARAATAAGLVLGAGLVVAAKDKDLRNIFIETVTQPMQIIGGQKMPPAEMYAMRKAGITDPYEYYKLGSHEGRFMGEVAGSYLGFKAMSAGYKYAVQKYDTYKINKIIGEQFKDFKAKGYLTETARYDKLTGLYMGDKPLTKSTIIYQGSEATKTIDVGKYGSIKMDMSQLRVKGVGYRVGEKWLFEYQPMQPSKLLAGLSSEEAKYLGTDVIWSPYGKKELAEHFGYVPFKVDSYGKLVADYAPKGVVTGTTRAWIYGSKGELLQTLPAKQFKYDIGMPLNEEFAFGKDTLKLASTYGITPDRASGFYGKLTSVKDRPMIEIQKNLPVTLWSGEKTGQTYAANVFYKQELLSSDIVAGFKSILKGVEVRDTASGMAQIMVRTPVGVAQKAGAAGFAKVSAGAMKPFTYVPDTFKAAKYVPSEFKNIGLTELYYAGRDYAKAPAISDFQDFLKFSSQVNAARIAGTSAGAAAMTQYYQTAKAPTMISQLVPLRQTYGLPSTSLEQFNPTKSSQKLRQITVPISRQSFKPATGQEFPRMTTFGAQAQSMRQAQSQEQLMSELTIQELPQIRLQNAPPKPASWIGTPTPPPSFPFMLPSSSKFGTDRSKYKLRRKMSSRFGRMKKSVSMPLPDWLSVNETEMKYHMKAHGLPLTPSVMKAYRRAEEKGTFTLRFPTYEQVKYGNRMPKQPQHGLRMMKPVGRTMRMGGKMRFGGRTMRLSTKSSPHSIRGKIKRLM